MPSICQGTWDCQICPKAVSNAITHVIYQRGFHKPAQKCEENLILFLMKGEILVNSKEYAGTMLKEGEFILQAIGSMFEMLAMTECECIYYRFIQPELFCDFRFNHIMKEVSPPLIYTPLKIIPELQYFLKTVMHYMNSMVIQRDDAILKAVLERELARQGQIFWVYNRVQDIIRQFKGRCTEISCHIGEKQFFLNPEDNGNINEAEFYIKTTDNESLKVLVGDITAYIATLKSPMSS